jgi:Uma2 family endonuclease
MTLAQLHSFISEADYLAVEKTSDVKHEYIDGDVYAMVGTSINHSYIAGNVHAALHQHLKGKPCQPHTSDVKVRVGTKYFYPDVMVDCSPSDGSGYFIETPTLIVEVLSKSTRQHDKKDKRNAYLQIPTLLEYVLIEQDFANIEVQRRHNHWQPENFFLGDDVTFDSIGLTTSVAELYDRVQNEDMTAWSVQQSLLLQELSLSAQN